MRVIHRLSLPTGSVYCCCRACTSTRLVSRAQVKNRRTVLTLVQHCNSSPQNLFAQVAKTIEQVTRLLQSLMRAYLVKQFEDGSLGD